MFRRKFCLVGAIGVSFLAWLSVSLRWEFAPGSFSTAIAAEQGEPFVLRITFGHGDIEATDWGGTLNIERGSLLRIQGWKLLGDDSVTSFNSWRLRSQRERPYGPEETALVNWDNIDMGKEPSPSGVFVYGKGMDSTEIQVTTKQGDFSVRLSDLNWDKPLTALSGAVEVQRVPAPVQISPQLRENDFPAVTSGPDGTIWAVWQSHAGGRDQVHLSRYAEGVWYTHTLIPGVSGDVWRPQVAVDGQGTVWVVWSQQVNSNWDLYAVAYHGTHIDAPVRLTSRSGPDMNARLTRDSVGRIHLVWQGVHGRYSQIYLKYLEKGLWSETFLISSADSNGNAWFPAIAADSTGKVYVSWDTYRSGNYDVLLRSFTSPGELGPEIGVATSARYEAHSSVACDKQNRVWVAWESGPPHWGKDLGYKLAPTGFGVAPGDHSEIRVAVVEGSRVRMPAMNPEDAFLSGDRDRSRYPELAIDSQNSVWLLLRHVMMRGATEGPGGKSNRFHWAAYVTRYTEGRWSRPQMLPSSVGRVSSFGQLAAIPAGGVAAVWHSDGRDYRELTAAVDNQVFAAILPSLPASEPNLIDRTEAALPDLGHHATEKEDIARIRSYRVRARGKVYEVVRGDLHRHAELSRDSGGGRDGSVLDCFRYMIDAGGLDFGALTEHQAGGSYEYWWWYGQKLTDLFHWPAFTSLFGYERTEKYPFGHRNVIHAQRGIPIVDFFTQPNLTGGRPPLSANSENLVKNDVKLLYDELHRTSGIAISHTSGTEMGTDWSDNDPLVEPVVEIFQGNRTSYEYVGAPLSVDFEKDKRFLSFPASRHRPDGYVSNAWAKGYRLGVIASSDHVSTHVSYAMVYTESKTREGVLDAIRRRRTYGATDNIILDCRVGEHLMGEEFPLESPPVIAIKAIGTAPISRVAVIKDNVVVYSAEPNLQEVSIEYRDNEGPGRHGFYYVRVEQVDNQVAWSSPFWIHGKPQMTPR